eukprot:TRINITY_DN28325_c0_g3_i1.p1 TRINITY_DN28325_c0_g3~~TRINITY_DN28325_c0_g3_i1.p1  ORF type:complete len:492 (+),score=53.36 TRINITY_DN28325_c0_g3_i1:174-1649(+)
MKRTIALLVLITYSYQQNSLDPGCPADFWDSVDTDCLGESSRNYKVYQGKVTSPNRHPYLVSLQIPSRAQSECYYHECGASLIAPDLVVTAAHCIYSEAHDWRAGMRMINSNGQIVEPRSGMLRVGLYAAVSPKCRNQGGNGRFQVTRYWLAPDYNVAGAGGDIAVLQLSEKVEGVQGVQIEAAEGINLEERELSILGYGLTSSREGDFDIKVMRRGDLRYVEKSLCEGMLRTAGTRLRFDPEKEFCAYSPLTDSCQGDSGGPILALDPSGDPTKDIQVGVVSWGPKYACSSLVKQYAGVYTRLDINLPWLRSVIAESKSSNLPSASLIQNTPGNCSQTLSNCSCKQSWFYKFVEFSGCQNPDQDSNGDWCVIDENSCEYKPTGQLVGDSGEVGVYYDYCRTECWSIPAKQEAVNNKSSLPDQTDVAGGQDSCLVTRAGCICQQNWDFGGTQQDGCSNPDSDVRGNWCKFVQGTCFLVPGGFDWDYCQADC